MGLMTMFLDVLGFAYPRIKMEITTPVTVA